MTYEIVSERNAKYAATIRCPADVYDVLTRYTTKRREHFLVLTLDGSHTVIRIHIASIGTVNRSLVHPREIFIKAITDSAAAIVVAHNHPSGHTEPSSEDDAVTKGISEAGEILGIKVLDHMIFGKNGFYSYLEHDRL